MDALTISEFSHETLESRYKDKLEKNYDLNRKLVSFQDNKTTSSYRWFKYKEGFSAALVQYILDKLDIKKGKVLDPFAGSGTTLFVSSQMGLESLGIELLPVGQEIMKVRSQLAGLDPKEIQETLTKWINETPWKNASTGSPLNYLRITAGAYPVETEAAISKYIACAGQEESPIVQEILRFAVLCVLEDISYTRKDGQYLRWDHRSGRRSGKTQFQKGEIKDFDSAISQKLSQILNDLKGELCLFPELQEEKKSAAIDVKYGSCLDILPTLEAESFDCLITSPPYCNRYDYTRTYALELAMLGVGEDKLKELRQTMLSCTVENRDKHHLKDVMEKDLYEAAYKAFDSQAVLKAIISYLQSQKENLNNPGIVRMVKNYFFEMSLVIFACARILKPNAPFVMVNDNVRYAGITIPVDLILSDIAELAGFTTEKIWVLPTGKGNSSQQMGEHGREELRKCVYIWRKTKGE